MDTCHLDALLPGLWYLTGIFRLSGAAICVISSPLNFLLYMSNIYGGEKKPVFTLKFYGVWIALSSVKSMKAGDSHLQQVKCNHITFLTFFNVPLLASCSMSRQVDASVIPGLGSSACHCHQSSFSSRRFFSPGFSTAVIICHQTKGKEKHNYRTEAKSRVVTVRLTLFDNYMK